MHISTKCSVAIHCLLFIHEYGESQRVTSDLLSLSTGSNPVTIRNILSALNKEGVVATKPGTGGATLCCPLHEISLYRVCRAIEPDFMERMIGVHGLPSPFCPVGRNIHGVLESTYQKVRHDVAESLKRVTMADVAADYHRALALEGSNEKTESGH